MSHTYQSTYITDEKRALSWWKALPPDYVAFRFMRNGELVGPDVIGKYDGQYGIGWKVYKSNNLANAVLVSAWQPKQWPATTWRIDVIWRKNKKHDQQFCEAYAKDVEICLIDLGVKPYVPGKSKPVAL